MVLCTHMQIAVNYLFLFSFFLSYFFTISQMVHEQEYHLLPKYNGSEEKHKIEEYDEEFILSSSSSASSSTSFEESTKSRIPHREHLKGVKEHIEEHFDRPELIKDCILGLSDGLTVPFALAAGLSSLGDSRIVIFGGLAGNNNNNDYYFSYIDRHHLK